MIKTDARTTVERPAPSNKLSEAEVRAVLDACHRPDTAHLPPTQIVPRLADEGVYLASESTFYRILKTEGMGARRGRAHPSRDRPRVSNDNPYSESLFRTLKYCPQWPESGFADLDAARLWVRDFIAWYNHEHRHSRIRFVTPAQRHRGEDHALLAKRHPLYEAAKARNPARWSGGTRNWTPVGAVDLNPQRQDKKAA